MDSVPNSRETQTRRKKERSTKQMTPEPVFRKVQKKGSTTILSLGKIIPKDWESVHITILEQTKDKLTIKIQKLVAAED